VRNVLESGRDYEYVPVDAEFEYRHPKYIINISYGAVSGTWPQEDDWYLAQEASFRQRLLDIANKHDLDFVIALSESGAGDNIAGTTELLVGPGVIFRRLFKDIWAHSVYELMLIEPATKLWTSSRLIGSYQIPESRWSELLSVEEPRVESLSKFIPEMEATIPPEDLWLAMCYSGLVPIPANARGDNTDLRCQRANYSRSKDANN